MALPLDQIHVIALALLQGLTEFLPISSSAHLVLAARLVSWSAQGPVFDAALHAGSLLAVIVYFREDLAQVLRSLWSWFRDGEADVYVRLLAQVVTATIPIVVMGLLLRDWIETNSRSVFIVASTTIGFAALMWVTDTRIARSATTEFELSWRDALLIGCIQILAIVPGTSRSGITIAAGLLLGMSREASSRFAFLLAIPTIAGAAALDTIGALENHMTAPVSHVLIGFTVSALMSFLAIRFFISRIERTGLTPYVAYLLVLASVLLGVGLYQA